MQEASACAAAEQLLAEEAVAAERAQSKQAKKQRQKTKWLQQQQQQQPQQSEMSAFKKKLHRMQCTANLGSIRTNKPLVMIPWVLKLSRTWKVGVQASTRFIAHPRLS